MLWRRIIVVEVERDEWGLPVINTYRKTGLFRKSLIHKNFLMHDTDIEKNLEAGVPAEDTLFIFFKRKGVC